MNQKSVNFSKKYRRSRTANGLAVNRRPTLICMEDSAQLASESSRVRLVQQKNNPGKSFPRDFASYFHGTTQNSDPAYVITSHYTRDSLPKRKTVLSTYPCTQSLRWSPYVETSSYDDETDIPDMSPDVRQDMRQHLSPQVRTEESKFKCRCESCTTKRCPSKEAFYNTMRPAYRNNIMTFCDQQTMTPRLSEVGCGSTPIPSTRVSDVSVTAADVAVRDTLECMQIPYHYSPAKHPVSILKNGQSYEEFHDYSQPHCCEQTYLPPTSYCLEPERDIHQQQYHIPPSKLSSIRSFFKCKKRKDCSSPRRNIYNEGISDAVANRYTASPLRPSSPTNLKKECSKSSVRSKCCVNEGIPFSYRTDSKYHQNCKKPYHKRSFYGDVNESRHLVTCPENCTVKKTSKPIRCHNMSNIKMPKRLLTSERDIESYIDEGYPQVLIPAAARR